MAVSVVKDTVNLIVVVAVISAVFAKSFLTEAGGVEGRTKRYTGGVPGARGKPGGAPGGGAPRGGGPGAGAPPSGGGFHKKYITEPGDASLDIVNGDNTIFGKESFIFSTPEGTHGDLLFEKELSCETPTNLEILHEGNLIHSEAGLDQGHMCAKYKGICDMVKKYSNMDKECPIPAGSEIEMANLTFPGDVIPPNCPEGLLEVVITFFNGGEEDAKLHLSTNVIEEQ